VSELNSSGRTRWLFHDPSSIVADYSFEMNPNAMTSPYPAKRTQSDLGSALSIKIRALRQMPLPQSWQFSGVIRGTAQDAAFRQWMGLGRAINVTDHFDRVWLVVPANYDPIEQRSSRRFSLKIAYTFSCLILGRIS
jgi:hypothetical protein